MPAITTPAATIPVATVFRTKDGAQHRVMIHGQPTANEHLAITPSFIDGEFDGRFRIIHVPTGLALYYGQPHELRDIAGRLAHLDWVNATKENFPDSDMAAEARKVIREAQLTDPSTTELPAHDAWGADGRGKGLPRAALPMVKGILADLQKAVAKTSGEEAVPLDIPDPTSSEGVRPNPEWTLWIVRFVHDFGLAYLLLALHQLDPELADSASAFLADCWDVGDSIGEWAWEWHQALLKGETPTLPGIPQHVELLGEAL